MGYIVVLCLPLSGGDEHCHFLFFSFENQISHTIWKYTRALWVPSSYRPRLSHFRCCHLKKAILCWFSAHRFFTHNSNKFHFLPKYLISMLLIFAFSLIIYFWSHYLLEKSWALINIYHFCLRYYCRVKSVSSQGETKRDEEKGKIEDTQKNTDLMPFLRIDWNADTDQINNSKDFPLNRCIFESNKTKVGYIPLKCH